MTADAHNQIARRARAGVLSALAVLLVTLAVAAELGSGPEPRGGRPEAAIVHSPS
jgi:hypothetical protein